MLASNLSQSFLNLSANQSTDDPLVAIETVALLVVGVSIMMLLVGGSNILLIAAVFKKKTRTLTDKIIASLAVTDTLVGLVVLPLAALPLIAGSWPLSQEACIVFITIDVLLCTNSIYHLVAIAVDRYCVATDPAYKRGNRKYDYFFPVAVFLSWTLSVAVSSPPLFIFRKDYLHSKQCVISQDRGYTVYSTIIAFFAPLMVIIIIYIKVFSVVKKTARKTKFKPTAPRISTSNASATTAEEKDLLDKNVSNSERENWTPQSEEGKGVTQHDTYASLNTSSVSKKARWSMIKTAILKPDKPKHSEASPQNRRAIQRERKAVRTLISITGTFVICWLPFFVYAFVTPFCGDWGNEKIRQSVGNILTWLGYSNSMLNPLIYTIFSPELRSEFKTILTCSCCKKC